MAYIRSKCMRFFKSHVSTDDASMKTLLCNGRLVLPQGIQNLDLLIDGEKIAWLGPTHTFSGAPDQTLDLDGAFVLPGFIDIHTHLDDHIGGFELADDYLSGSRIALQNGITTLAGFITQHPNESLEAAILRVQLRAQKAITAVHFHLTPTGFEGEDWAFLESLPGYGIRTIKLYTTYRQAGLYCDEPQMKECFKRLSGRGLTFLIHAEDDAVLTRASQQNLDFTQPITHARLRPEGAELRAVQRVLALARACDAKLHFVHISTLEAAQCIAQAKAADQAVTCETCPQYLWLDERALEGPQGHRYICSPPLRNQRQEFRALARQGYFDCYATDHCAFKRSDKDLWAPDIQKVPGGLPGLGALPHLVYRLWESEPEQAVAEMALRLSLNPARLLGMEHRKGALSTGYDADLVVFKAFPKTGHPKKIQSSLNDCHEPYARFKESIEIQWVFKNGKIAPSPLNSPSSS